MSRTRTVAITLILVTTLAILAPFQASMQKRGSVQKRNSGQTPSSQPSKPAPITNRDVIRLMKAKVSDDLIIANNRA